MPPEEAANGTGEGPKRRFRKLLHNYRTAVDAEARAERELARDAEDEKVAADNVKRAAADAVWQKRRRKKGLI